MVSSQCAGQHLRPRFRPRCRGLHEPAEEAELALALAQAEEELAQAEKELAAESACELVLGSDHSAGAAAGSQALADEGYISTNVTPRARRSPFEGETYSLVVIG